MSTATLTHHLPPFPQCLNSKYGLEQYLKSPYTNTITTPYRHNDADEAREAEEMKLYNTDKYGFMTRESWDWELRLILEPDWQHVYQICQDLSVINFCRPYHGRCPPIVINSHPRFLWKPKTFSTNQQVGVNSNSHPSPSTISIVSDLSTHPTPIAPASPPPPPLCVTPVSTEQHTVDLPQHQELISAAIQTPESKTEEQKKCKSPWHARFMNEVLCLLCYVDA
eukprot:GHVQ01041737.1.p1 GENE.GHVQ01041737.1~~GHVQ01041737.1.p1  ORF type:complete len:224 (-),score=37.58 GHVQ01041737.1:872-1543(-)